VILPKIKADILWLGINEAGDLKIVDKNYDVTTIPGIGKAKIGKPLELSDTDLRKLVVAGVSEDVGKGMFKDRKSGFSWDEIQQNLIDQYGEEKGKWYYDTAKPIIEKTGVTEWAGVIPQK